jgi:hypothetical protein
MSLEDASKAGNQIVTHDMDSRKCCPIANLVATPRVSSNQTNQSAPLGETPSPNGRQIPAKNISWQIPDNLTMNMNM